MWNTYRLSPTVLYVNAQEQKNITNKCLTNASGPLIRYNVAADSDNGGPYGVSASGVVRWYYNPFSVDGGFDIPVKVHPDLPPGTILALCERLPVWYQSNQTPNVAEVLTRRDYYRVDWPLRTRRREFGVYAEEDARGLRAVRRRHPHQHRQRMSRERRAGRRERGAPAPRSSRAPRPSSVLGAPSRHVAIRSHQSRRAEGLARPARRALRRTTRRSRR